MASGDDEERGPAAPSSSREREVLRLLGEVDRGDPGPDPQASARMRARLMAAIASPDGATGDATADTTDLDVGHARTAGARTRAGGRSRRPGRRRAPTGTRPAGRSGADRPGADRPGARPTVGRRARLLTRATGAFAIVLLLGLVLVVSGRGALPGEALYGIKRASENAELGLTVGQENRARRHLQLAEVRLGEVSGLLAQASGSGSGPVAAGLDATRSALVADTLVDFQVETREGVRLFLPLTSNPSGPAPAVLAGWARAQSDHLDAIAPSLPGVSRPALDSSRALLGQVTARADELAQPVASCPRTATDEWGPVPSCVPAPVPLLPSPVPAPGETVDPSAATSTSTPPVTADPGAPEDATTGSASAPRRTASVPQPAPVVPAAPRLPTIDPPRLPAAPRVPGLPGLPSVDVPPVFPNLPGVGG